MQRRTNMGTRASFNGRIVFRALHFDVKAYAVAESAKEHLHILHNKCGVPINMIAMCPQCGQNITAENRVMGAAWEDRFVAITKEELEQITPEAEENRPLLVAGTIDPSQVNPLWYDKNYYLQPSDYGSKISYATFSRALYEERSAAVVTYVVRGKYHLGMILPAENSLILCDVYYPEHIKSLKDYNIENEPLAVTKEAVTLVVN